MSLSEKFNAFRHRLRRRNPYKEFVDAVLQAPNPSVDIRVEKIKGHPRCQTETGEQLVVFGGG